MWKSIASFFGRALLRAALDKQLQQTIYRSVSSSAKDRGLSGSEKMERVLNEVKDSGIKALLSETDSTLRTKIELAVDDLNV